ncbi:MAG: SDR family oxidoreductase [Flavobacteriales bacterium]|jgi:enoyl-[acyl-carrier protein] reductase I|nr:SDR family oxidoreductase [Flavobacteriales bacterium]
MAYDLLKGKKGIIFGALDDRSIAWKIAEKCHDEGADFVLTNAPVALRMGKISELGEKVGAEVIPADVTVMEDLDNLVGSTKEKFGGIDFILHSVGMSPNVRKGRAYTDLNYDFFHKTVDISAMSLHRILQTCMKTDALNEWASVVALTYIASQRTYSGYGDMAEAKALLESIARSFGYHYGIKNKVRINTVSQSPTVTTAGSGVAGFDDFIGNANRMSPLGNATAEECADYCITLFSDLTKKVTMQNLFHDGGYSSMGEAER